MKPGQRSETADLMAAVRAEHLLYDHPVIFEDPFAIHLTSAFWRGIVRSRALNWLVVRKFLGSLRPVHAEILGRSRFAEEQLRKAIVSGVTQYVNIGAGLDSFALRHADLADSLTVYELDHPVTQHAKRERLASLAPQLPPNLKFVPIDFEKETFAAPLRMSGYSSMQPAFFAWLGTTFYLTRRAVLETLGAIASLAAPGSEVVFDYLVPEEQLGLADRTWLRKLMRFVGRRGEPLITSLNPETLGEEMGELGFELAANLSAAEQKAQFFPERSDGLDPPNAFRFAHLVVR